MSWRKAVWVSVNLLSVGTPAWRRMIQDWKLRRTVSLKGVSLASMPQARRIRAMRAVSSVNGAAFSGSSSRRA